MWALLYNDQILGRFSYLSVALLWGELLAARGISTQVAEELK